MNYGVGYQRLVTGLLAVAAMLAGSVALADGTTERERTMSRYTKCKWTDAMSKQLYECVKRNDGFNTHWCFDETVQTNCEPEPLAVVAENEVKAEQPVSQEEQRNRAARQGEENLRGTIEREQTMLKYKDCKWTDEMGKYTYECVKRNNGFGTHWCYDEALQLHCPAPETEPRS